MNQHRLYSLLKGYRLTLELIAEVQTMDPEEMRRGVLEFLTMLYYNGDPNGPGLAGRP
ncbi:MAG: hypothetical protein QHH10_10385 [Peptococcaceae bacterium]|jgi:hypothetical protein|nr:hypothetical protein [Peptococcaceae bacterium]MDH7525705.1 hypothetical protein [Peptococcaceae bacterium]